MFVMQCTGKRESLYGEAAYDFRIVKLSENTETKEVTNLGYYGDLTIRSYGESVTEQFEIGKGYKMTSEPLGFTIPAPEYNTPVMNPIQPEPLARVDVLPGQVAIEEPVKSLEEAVATPCGCGQ